MKTAEESLSTNPRLISSLLTKYKNTFYAFKELINNSLQAKAKNIHITINYSEAISVKSGIGKIVLRDDGYGVSYSDFKEKILQIGSKHSVSSVFFCKFS